MQWLAFSYYLWKFYGINLSDVFGRQISWEYGTGLEIWTRSTFDTTVPKMRDKMISRVAILFKGVSNDESYVYVWELGGTDISKQFWY